MSERVYAPERRPLRARETRWAKGLASALAASGMRPNTISLLGAVCAVLGGLSLACSVCGGWTVPSLLAAALLMTGRALANMLDGMVAISTGAQSPVGELYNEVPDRVSDPALLIGAGYAWGGMPELGYLAACAALFVAYVRAQGKAAGASQEFCGPMAKTHRMAVLMTGTLTSVASSLAFGSTAENWRILSVTLGVIIVGCVVTAIRRLSKIARALQEAAT